MKPLYVILLIALFCKDNYSFASKIISPYEICQFDKSTMITQKLKKAQECINNKNYTGAKNYLNGVLKLDPKNAKAKELLVVCENGGKSNTSSSNNRANANLSNNTRNSNSTFSISKSELTFSSNGGSEYLTVYGNSDWKISVNPYGWGHLDKNENTLTLKVDANNTGSKRTDYFKIKSGTQEIQVNITQEANTVPYLNISNDDIYVQSKGGTERLAISSNCSWKITTSTASWGHLSQKGDSLILVVDANYTGNKRTDYFKITAGNIEKKITITQSPTYAKNSFSLEGSCRSVPIQATALTSLTKSIKEWDKCRMGAITDSGIGIVVTGTNGYAYTTPELTPLC